MARKQLTQFERARLSRRIGGIDQLATQYQRNIEQITSQYQQAFSQYQQSVATQMAPYEAALNQYQNVDFPAYEAAATRYRMQLEAYNRELADIAANPVIETQQTRPVRGGRVTETFYDPRPIPEFTAKAPSAPSAPTAPTITPFDGSQFDEQRAQAQTVYKRELSERRGARISAVSRRSARPLMQGA